MHPGDKPCPRFQRLLKVDLAEGPGNTSLRYLLEATIHSRLLPLDGCVSLCNSGIYIQASSFRENNYVSVADEQPQLQL